MEYLVLENKEDTVSIMCFLNACLVNCDSLTSGCIIRLK